MVHRFAAAIDAKRTRLRAIGERLRQLGHPHLATVLVDQSRNIVATAPTVFAYDCYRRRLNVAERAREIAAGHPFTVGNGVVYFSNEADQRLYRQGGDGQPRPITPLPTPGDGDAALR